MIYYFINIFPSKLLLEQLMLQAALIKLCFEKNNSLAHVWVIKDDNSVAHVMENVQKLYCTQLCQMKYGEIENVQFGKKNRPALSSVGQEETEKRFNLNGPNRQNKGKLPTEKQMLLPEKEVATKGNPHCQICKNAFFLCLKKKKKFLFLPLTPHTLSGGNLFSINSVSPLLQGVCQLGVWLQPCLGRPQAKWASPCCVCSALSWMA